MKRIFLKQRLWLSAVTFLFSLAGMLVAAPFDRQFTYHQPDGANVLLHGWGDDFYATFETMSGYTVVFDQSQKAYCYARRDVSGDLVSVGVQAHVGNPSALGLSPHERATESVRKAQTLSRWVKWDSQMQVSSRWQALKASAAQLQRGADGRVLNAPPSFPAIGNKLGLTILVDFSDDPATVPQTEIFNYCNADNYTGYGNNGSVKKFYYDVSGGLLVYSNVVTVYVRVPQPKTYYNDITQDAGQQANLLIKDAIDALKALPNYNSQILPQLNNLTVDGANQVLACNVFFAGQNSGVFALGLWPNSWSLYLVGAQPLGNGKSVFRYQITDIGAGLTLGTFCHENGHMLCGYPDLYDYDYDSIGGAGSFCLMSYGSYNGGGIGLNPAQICAYLKRASGWGTTSELTTASNLLLTASAAATTGTNINQFYRFQKPGTPTEYYIIENRQKLGRDADIPGAGLAIWHVDELGDGNNQNTNYNNLHLNYELSLIQADNLFHFQRNLNYGDVNDLFYSGNTATTYTNAFSDFTSPQKSYWWDGTPSGIRITAISGLSTNMTFIFGDGTTNATTTTTATITAPRPPWGTTLGVMNGSNPNGDWLLFVQDDKPLDTGVISNGWALTLTSANPVGFASDNQMFVTPANANVTLGGTWSVTFSVTNYGPSIATNILVTDNLPADAGLTFSGATPSVGSVSQVGSAVLWSIPTLATNGGAQLNVSFTATIVGSYTNSLTVSSGTTDPNPDDDTVTAVANVAVITPPSFSSVTFTNGRPTFSVTNSSGPVSVIIQANTNLANVFSWVPIYTNTTPFSFTDLSATNFPYRFYRTLLGP